ncbi:MAG: hypothetical protein ACI9WT_001766, partial [Flavobacterium sp.]
NRASEIVDKRAAVGMYKGLPNRIGCLSIALLVVKSGVAQLLQLKLF